MTDQLFEKQPGQNDIVSIKLANGDELLAKIVAVSDKIVSITKPLMMMLGQDARGNPGIQLIPFWMLGADKDGRFPINRDHIVCMVKANSDASNSYVQQTTGLAIPATSRPSGLIT